MKELKIRNQRVIIREAVKSDAGPLLEYVNTVGGESDFLTFSAGQFGSSIEQEEKFLENSMNKKNFLYIVAEINGKIIASLNFCGGSRPRTTHVGEFGITVLKEYWGYGLGGELIKYMIDWSKDSGIVRKINLRVRTDNERGIHLYKKFGFVEEGILKRDFLIDGKFYDSLHMGLLID